MPGFSVVSQYPEDVLRTRQNFEKAGVFCDQPWEVEVEDFVKRAKSLTKEIEELWLEWGDAKGKMIWRRFSKTWIFTKKNWQNLELGYQACRLSTLYGNALNPFYPFWGWSVPMSRSIVFLQFFGAYSRVDRRWWELSEHGRTKRRTCRSLKRWADVKPYRMSSTEIIWKLRTTSAHFEHPKSSLIIRRLRFQSKYFFPTQSIKTDLSGKCFRSTGNGGQAVDRWITKKISSDVAYFQGKHHDVGLFLVKSHIFYCRIFSPMVYGKWLLFLATFCDILELTNGHTACTPMAGYTVGQRSTWGPAEFAQQAFRCHHKNHTRTRGRKDVVYFSVTWILCIWCVAVAVTKTALQRVTCWIFSPNLRQITCGSQKGVC